MKIPIIWDMDKINNVQEHWNRLVTYEKIAAGAFKNVIVVGVELVQLKLELGHGMFSKGVEEYVPQLSTRTVRRYRQIGELYLSAAHNRVMIVGEMRRANVRPDESLCTDTAIESYLEQTKVRSAEDLKIDACKKVPKLIKTHRVLKNRKAKDEMEHVRRCWAKMNDEQKSVFIDAITRFLLENTVNNNGAQIGIEKKETISTAETQTVGPQTTEKKVE